MSAGHNCWSRIGTFGDRTCPELKTHVHCRNCPAYATGAARLFDVEASAEYLAEQAQRFAQRKAIVRAGARSAVIFRLGGEWLALPTAIFSEVTPPRPVHSLPHRRDGIVIGLANIRGELLICVSLAAALGLAAAAAPGPTARFAVLRRERDRFVFAADEVAGVQRFDDDQLGPAPATIAHAQATYTRGMLAWENRAVGVLDAELLFHTLNRHVA